jgi:phosphoribosylaminoimidazole-succinocarboxamide synthase
MLSSGKNLKSKEKSVLATAFCREREIYRETEYGMKDEMIMEIVLETNIGNRPPSRGKVRDIYDLGDKLLIVASDRLSAFDVIMANGIPYKGIVLTRISRFWFDFLSDSIEHHLISDNVATFPEPFCDHPKQLTGRSMLVKKVEVLPVECVVRGYLAGSGWKEYQQNGTVCGQKLPAGLKQCEKLPELIFTPATKAELGQHDENISFERCVDIIGAEAADYVRSKSTEIFQKASDYAESKGIILADTKFEWGLVDGKIILIDEVLTPDSSRFWPADKYEDGRDQESFDKQFVRNYLESINFDKSGPGVVLPDDITAKTSDKYIEAYERLTGKEFEK